MKRSSICQNNSELYLRRTIAFFGDQLIKSAGISIGQTVLDVATGTGQPALTIAKIVGQDGRVMGVDLSPEMIEVAKEESCLSGPHKYRRLSSC